MVRDRARWHFNNEKYGYDMAVEGYPEIKSDLSVLLSELISSGILIPNGIDDYILPQYKDVGELIEIIENSRKLKDSSEFDIWGNTVIYTPDGELIFENIVRVEGFRTFQQSFIVCIKTDYWLPMVLDSERMSFSWNLELHRLNYHRLPALIKRLKEALQWTNEYLLSWDNNYTTLQAGYDFFLEENVIGGEYRTNPNLEFDLDAYLAAMKEAKERYS